MKQDDYRYRYASPGEDEDATRDGPAQDADPSEQGRQTVVRGLPTQGNGPSPRDAGQQGRAPPPRLPSDDPRPSRPLSVLRGGCPPDDARRS